MPTEPSSALQARSLTKRFAGVTALDGVDFELRPGEIHALVGENGAGKSTLIKVLSGVHAFGSYEGEVRLGAARVRFTSTRDADRAGVAVIHQELALVESLSAAENIFLGREPTRFGLIDHDRMREDAQAALDRFGVRIDASTKVAELSVAGRQLVEIARALSKRARVLILDEPTAALSTHEVEILLAVLRKLRADGLSCIYISHKLDEVLGIADRITVLRDGRHVRTLPAIECDAGSLVRDMVGRDIKQLFEKGNSTSGEVVLRVERLTVRGPALTLYDIDLELHAGEVLGVGGLMGAGRSELLLHLFGLWGVREAGQAELLGAPLAGNTPADTIDRGMVLVSEDRKRLGLCLDHSVRFNLSLSSLSSCVRHGLIDPDVEDPRALAQCGALHVKTAGLDASMASLSGGNQQKVVIGKALLTRPKVILLDEPTRGIDIGAKAEIYELIAHLKREGIGILLVSSELPELIGLSDRIVMLNEGRVAAEFKGADATEQALLSAALGTRANGESAGVSANSRGGANAV